MGFSNRFGVDFRLHLVAVNLWLQQ